MATPQPSQIHTSPDEPYNGQRCTQHGSRGRTRTAIACAVLAIALPTLAACSVPGRDEAPNAKASPETTPAIQTTRAAPMPIVTATPVTAGNTETSGTPEPPSEVPGTYVVQESDSLYAIALRFGVELNALITANGLSDPNDIQIGQELIIPTTTP